MVWNLMFSSRKVRAGTSRKHPHGTQSKWKLHSARDVLCRWSSTHGQHPSNLAKELLCRKQTAREQKIRQKSPFAWHFREEQSWDSQTADLHCPMRMCWAQIQQGEKGRPAHPDRSVPWHTWYTGNTGICICTAQPVSPRRFFPSSLGS